MLAHKTEQAALGDNMVEFLGEVDAREAASWWALAEHGWLAGWLVGLRGGGMPCLAALGRVPLV